MAVIEYDKSQGISEERRLQSLADSVRRAFEEIEAEIRAEAEVKPETKPETSGGNNDANMEEIEAKIENAKTALKTFMAETYYPKSGGNVNGSVIIPNAKGYYSNDKSGSARQVMAMNTSNTLVIGQSNYDKADANTNMAGNDVGIYSAAAGKVGYRPYYRAGDSIAIYNFVAGYVTNSGTHICFIIPLSKPVLGSPTVTVTSSDGLIIRQNGKYTHGTAAGTFVKPSVYDEILDDNAVRITATINTTTNVVNNGACGIQASLIITFS